MIAAVAQVEAIDDFEVVVDEVAKREVVGGLGEDKLAEGPGLFEVGGGYVAELDVVGFEADPAARTLVIGFILQGEGAALAASEFFEAGVVLADAVEKMEDRLVIKAHVELQKEPAIDVELVALCTQIVGHTPPRARKNPARGLVATHRPCILIMGDAKPHFNGAGAITVLAAQFTSVGAR